MRRALLTISVDDKYEFYHYWWSFWNVVDSDKRRLIDKFREIEYLIHSDSREYFKNLLLELRNKDIKRNKRMISLQMIVFQIGNLG